MSVSIVLAAFVLYGVADAGDFVSPLK